MVTSMRSVCTTLWWGGGQRGGFGASAGSDLGSAGHDLDAQRDGAGGGGRARTGLRARCTATAPARRRLAQGPVVVVWGRSGVDPAGDDQRGWGLYRHI